MPKRGAAMPFTQAAIDFLTENRLHDSREWYAENKGRYKAVLLEPLTELVARLAPSMLKIDPQLITEPRVDRTISRIYRDTRFSKDKSLYRDNMWVVFMREKKLYEGPPAFYFDMGPRGFSYGMGYYQASSDAMNAIREMALREEPPFKKADKAYRAQSLFIMDGDVYKRSKHPNATERQREWLDRKTLSFNRASDDFSLLFSEELPDTLLEGYRTLAPIYEYFCAAESRRAAQQL
jgi:uncharacterized protein (TIGR02453 family)